MGRVSNQVFIGVSPGHPLVCTPLVLRTFRYDLWEETEPLMELSVYAGLQFWVENLEL